VGGGDELVEAAGGAAAGRREELAEFLDFALGPVLGVGRHRFLRNWCGEEQAGRWPRARFSG
jgi:hypothetical protein